MKNYLVDILTPDKVVAQGVPVKDISVSTVKGEVNILANHTHFITNLLTGLLTLRGTEKDLHFSVENGICKVLGDRITILSSTSFSKDQIDLGKTEGEVTEINKTLNKTDLMSDNEINDLYKRLEVLESHIKLNSI